MKPYLVDVPVRVNIWIRPDAQKRQFEVIKQARPSIMFLVSDGGRNEKEWEAIRQNRKMIDEGIDWECTVYRFYEEENNGLYGIGEKYTNFLWETVDRCIFLEDDQIPSVSYFKYCSELLEKYKDDERIEAICARNQIGIWGKATADYFFAKKGSIWGLATWRRTQQQRDNTFAYGADQYIMELLKHQTKKDKKFWKSIAGYPKNKFYGNHIAGDEFYHQLEVYAQNRLYIIPKKNLINNIGCTENSAHAQNFKMLPRATKKLFNVKTYELDFPIKHPRYVIPDEQFVKERNKLLGNGTPFLKFSRKIESFFLALIHSGIKGIIVRIKNKIMKKKTIEK